MPVHKFEVGQKLLCFEPDASKAKVIYVAKILSQVHHGSNMPFYEVHFQGWKGKWDREVPENLLLENTEFNRMLKKKIDEIIRTVRCRAKRKHLIDQVLEIASVSGDDIDWDQIPAGPKRKRVHSEENKATVPENSLPQEVTFLDKTACELTDFSGSESLDEEDMIQLEFECLQIHRWFFVPIGLSSNLLSILNANLSGAVATGSGWCSVLQLLQSYLDGFPYEFSRAQSTQRHARPERASRTLGPAYAQSDRNRIICADVCSSLRVLFDNMSEFYIRSDERKNAVYGRMRFTSNGGAFPPGTLAPDVKSSHNFTSPRLELLPASAAVASPDLPSLCYPAHYLLRLFPTLSKLLGSMSITTCRLAIVTRHVSMLLDYLDLTRSFWFSKTEPPHKESGMHPPASSSSSTFQEKKNTSVTASASESSGSTEPQVQGFRSLRHASQRHANPVLVPRPKVMQAENESTFLEGNEMKAGPIRRSSVHRTLRSSVSEEPDGQTSTFDASVPMGALTRRKETHQKPIEATEDVRSSTRSSRESASRTDLDAVRDPSPLRTRQHSRLSQKPLFQNTSALLRM